MVSTNKNASKKNIWTKTIFVVVLILLLAAGIIAYSSKNSANVARKTQTASVNTPNINRKESSTPSSTLDNGNGSNNSSGNTNTSSVSGKQITSGNFQVQIVSSSVNNGNLHIGDVVSGTTQGECTLTASQAGQSTLQLATSPVRQDVNDYDCGVFNISTSRFPTSGAWTIVLSVTENGTSASKSVTVNI